MTFTYAERRLMAYEAAPGFTVTSAVKDGKAVFLLYRRGYAVGQYPSSTDARLASWQKHPSPRY